MPSGEGFKPTSGFNYRSGTEYGEKEQLPAWKMFLIVVLMFVLLTVIFGLIDHFFGLEGEPQKREALRVLKGVI